MKIAQVAPLVESVPPKFYGGTERIVSYLTEELVKQGHEVTLFASGDSVTNARLEAIVPEALRLKEDSNPTSYHILMIEQVLKQASSFDIIHFHIDSLQFPNARRMKVPHVTTLHGRLDLHDFMVVLNEYRDLPMISISDDQRHPVPDINWQATVYNGIPSDLYTFHAEQGGYLAFLGRISPEKGVDHAIEIAKQVNMPLKIAAKVDKADESYFRMHVKPLLDHPLIEYVGEIDEEGKDEFLGNAYALMLPINWPEPFGLVLIEAMACGTPVIAYRRGAIPEIVENGVNGYIVAGIEDANVAVDKIKTIDRHACRKTFLERFSANNMAAHYVQIYENLIDSNTKGPSNNL